MTFSTNPSWCDLSGHKTLFEKAKGIKNADWGGSTDFYEAIKLLVETTKEE